jgi:hypothetical protein
MNHSKIIALYEASRECAWLRKMIDHIQKSCRIGAIKSPIIIYEDNAACVAQIQMGYIKTNYTKHISPKLFYPHELKEGGEISILQIKSCDNLVDLFTKSLPLAKFNKCVKGIGMCRLKDLQGSGGRFSLNRISCFLISTEKIYYLFLQESSYMISSTVQGGVLEIHSEYKFKLQVCGQFTSQNKDQTQALTSSGIDNNEVFKLMRRTEVIKHMLNLPRVTPIQRHHTDSASPLPSEGTQSHV